jgi:homoserine dehydrogenase
MTVAVAVLGLGSVGRGILETVRRKPELGIVITAVADSKSGIIAKDGLDIAGILERKKIRQPCGDPGITANDVVSRADYDILVEVTPTNADTGEPALSYMKAAIGRGKHVVTSNKGPISRHLAELKKMALENGVRIRYEATVGGAIPIMHTLGEGIRGNNVLALYGVLNGTCNFILTRMAAEGLTYDQALAEARELGYAEADPTYDVKGIDAAIKLVILANTIWEKQVSLGDIDITGIDLLTTDALRLAEEQNCTIRLIAEALPEKGLLRVSPRLIRKDHPLVFEGTLNALSIQTDMAGEITLIGKGAGSIETASAVIGDILSIDL